MYFYLFWKFMVVVGLWSVMFRVKMIQLLTLGYVSFSYFFAPDKIETVTDIRLKDVGKTCINITWTLPWAPALNKDELLYRIELTEERREKLLNKVLSLHSC